MLNPVYTKTDANCPFCISVKFSAVNDEKVVKPPQIPTIKNRRKPGEMISLFAETPIINPISKLPATFTVNVPMGIDKTCQFKFNF